MALLEGCEVDDLDEGHDETRRYKSLSHGPMPVISDANGMEEAIATAIATAKRWQAEDEDGHAKSTCVIASSQQFRGSLDR